MNKILAFIMAIIFALGLETTIYAQENRTIDKQAKMEDKGLASTGTFKDQDLIGLRVENSQGQDLGRISSLAIDPNDGRVAFGVLQYGGFWGFGAKNVAVPLTAMSLKLDKNGRPDKFVLDMNKQDLASAPTFGGSGWPDRRQVEESYRFFGQTPYWTETAGHGGFDISITGHIGKRPSY